MKKVWITALNKDKKNVPHLITTAQKYGLDADGHFWINDLKKMTWMAVVPPLVDSSVSLWVISGTKEDLIADVRYGLVLLYLAVMKEKAGINVIWVDTDGGIEGDMLPSVFAGIDILDKDNPSLGPKFAAQANLPPKSQSNEFRLHVHANPGFGVWFETGPGNGMGWNGALLAVDKGEIKAHGVGDKAKIPEKSTLEYPVQGVEFSLGSTKLTGWGVQNKLTCELSYFVKVEGVPGNIVFGSNVDEDNAEMHVLNMHS